MKINDTYLGHGGTCIFKGCSSRDAEYSIKGKRSWYEEGNFARMPVKVSNTVFKSGHFCYRHYIEILSIMESAIKNRVDANEL